MATARQKETLADTQATVLHQDAEHTVYRLDGADGEVVQTVYPVFPGIEIAYHDVHATACAMQRTHAPGCLEIHHCREGRIAYPYGVAQADPDNTAESVNAILKAGTNVGAWHGTTSNYCKGVAFVRSKNLNHGGRHLVRLLVFPVPDGFQMLEAIADSADASWEEHDRRLK